MHILIAPNAYKNSLDAKRAAEAIDRGLHRSGMICTTRIFPIADGGDGTADLLSAYLGGAKFSCKVNGPFGVPLTSSFSLVPDQGMAIIELAAASGLRLISPDKYDPLRATTIGTGELIRCALDKGVKEIVLCIGGSATVDGGAGALRALGMRFLDHEDRELDGSPAEMLALHAVDTARLDPRIHQTKITILCDVENPLLGASGAAAVFGPQKGANPEQVVLLEKFLSRFCRITFHQTGKEISTLKHGGAAGGISAGFYAYLGAELVNGIDCFLKLTRYDLELSKADLVITGEGSLDEQTLGGKGPFGVAIRAKSRGIPIIAFAGKLTDTAEMRRHFDELIAINPQNISIEMALRDTAANLEEAVAVWATNRNNSSFSR
jgi:glycerate 2-kinase